MLKEGYQLYYAELWDVNLWMKLAVAVRYNFPGLETVESMDDYRQTLIKNINRNTALCVKHDNDIVGVLLFSYNSQCLSCMAVHPEHRRCGIASAMIEEMIAVFPAGMDISVTTFRSDDIKGQAPRALYKKYGFAEDELITEFGYPLQRFILHRK